MGAIASQITSFTIVYSIVYSYADQRKHQSSASLAFVRGIYSGPVNSPHEWPVTRKMFPFDDVIMSILEKKYHKTAILHINPLGPSYTTWQHRSGSTSTQVMICCLTAPSHYLNQCWLINLTRDTTATNHLNKLKYHLSKISFKSPRGQWVQVPVGVIIMVQMQDGTRKKFGNKIETSMWAACQVWVKPDSCEACLGEITRGYHLDDCRGGTKKKVLSGEVNSLAPGRFQFNFRYIIFKLTLVNGGLGISCEIALIWMSLDSTDDLSRLFQLMAWCHQATSHYLSQCWPRSLSPYDVTRPQWVNSLRPRQNGHFFADDTFKRIFLNENIRIAIKISLNFVPKGLINNIPALVLIMAWLRPGDKPLS